MNEFKNVSGQEEQEGIMLLEITGISHSIGLNSPKKFQKSKEKSCLPKLAIGP